MNRSLLLFGLACLALCQSTLATPLPAKLPGFCFPADTTRPIIVCPANDTVQLGPGQCVQAVMYAAVTATDNLPGVVVAQTVGLASGAVFMIGSTVNTFVATDTAHNTASCSFTVTVRNFYNVLICKESSIIKLDANCTHVVAPTDILTPGENGCSANFIVEVDKTFPFGNGPWLPATMTANDVNKSYQFRITAPTTGNRCFGLGEIKDTLPPTISCQNFDVSCIVTDLSPAYLNDSLSISAAQPSYTDNCGSTPTLTYSDVATSLPCDPNSTLSGIITRTWVAKDASNNQSSCVQKINRVHSLTNVKFPPARTLNCVNADLSQQTNGMPFIELAGVHFPLITVAACQIQASFVDTIVPQCGGTRLVRRTWRVQDLCRPLSATNPKIGVQNLQIQDNGAPVITCPPTTVLRINTFGCQGKIKLPDAVISDGCSRIAKFAVAWPATEGGQVEGYLKNWPGNNPAIRDTLGGLDSLDFPTGVTTMQYFATDACGNTSSCSFTLIVSDTMPPTAFCRPFLTVQLSPTGTLELPADSLDDGSTDICTPVSFKARRQLANSCQPSNQFYDAVQFCCSDVGDTIALRLRVYDRPLPTGPVSLSLDSSYNRECTVHVRITDPHPPQCVAPADVVVQCDTFDRTLNAYGSLISRSCAVDSLIISVDYDQFDTTCRRGQIVRTFQVMDDNGNSTNCTQRITVNTTQHYFVRFPNDTIVAACAAANAFGEPEFFGLHCERTQVTFTDQAISSTSGTCLKIERTWKIINRCQYDSLQPLTIVPNPEPNASPDSPQNLPGPIVSASGTTGLWAPSSIKLTATAATPTNFSTFWAANTNGYQYKQTIHLVDTKAPVFAPCPTTAVTFLDSSINSNELWQESVWLDPTTGLHDLSDASVVLSATALDSCWGENINLSYILFLDLDGNGEQETVVKSSNVPAFGTINFGNAFNTNYTGGTPRTFDERTVPSSQKYGFALETAVVNHQKKAWVRWNTSQTPLQYINPQLPRGQHKISWTAEDGCGNTATCQYNFIIRDGQPPVLTCTNAAFVRSIGPDHNRQIDVNEIPQQSSDNYSPNIFLQYGLRRAGSGNDFPVDSTGQPRRTLTYTCADLGVQSIQLWVRDQDHNASFCMTTLTIQDPNNLCVEALLNVKGSLSTSVDSGISEAKIGIHATFPGMSPYDAMVTSDSAGHYMFPLGLPTGTAYTLTPVKDGNALNGVTTYDLVLISRHILGLTPITSPYRIIAADANKSNSITALDIIELRKLILGIYDNGLPLTKSWRFVDKAFVFPNPANPFQTPFPETRSVASMVAGQPADNFVGIKVGDVDGSAMTHLSGTADDRSSEVLWFEATDQIVQAGEMAEVIFRATEAVAGYQFTLDYPGLEVVDIQPGATMQPDNFAVFAARNALTTSFEATETTSPAAFTVRFRARQAGRLSQLLRISGRITPSQAYALEEVAPPLGVGLRFGPATGTGGNFELLPCTPNPFREQTTIGFRLPKATTATLSIFDAAGKTVFVHTADYAAGFQAITIQKSDLGGSGVFFYQLQTPTGSAVQKMVVIR